MLCAVSAVGIKWAVCNVAWCTSRRCMNSQHRYWGPEDSQYDHEAPLQDLKLGFVVQLVLRVDGVCFYTKLFGRCMRLILSVKWMMKKNRLGVLCKAVGTHHELSCGCSALRLRWTSHEWRILAFAVAWFKSLRLRFVGHAGRKSARKRSVLFGRTSRRY